jgi:hypothetical protein
MCNSIAHTELNSESMCNSIAHISVLGNNKPPRSRAVEVLFEK